MGQTADEIERELDGKRRALTERVDRLEQRVRDDVSSARKWGTGRVQDVKDAATNVGDDAVHKAESIAMTEAGSGTTVAEHPKALLAGSAAAGLLLGLKGGDSGDDDRQPRRSTSGQRPGIITMVTDSFRDVIGIEANALVDGALDTATAGLKALVMAGAGSSSAGGDDRPVRTLYREGRTPDGDPFTGNTNGARHS